MAGRELQAYSSLSESFTPDHKPLMGEAPELRGFFLGCGFNSAGKRGQQCIPTPWHPCEGRQPTGPLLQFSEPPWGGALGLGALRPCQGWRWDKPAGRG